MGWGRRSGPTAEARLRAALEFYADEKNWLAVRVNPEHLAGTLPEVEVNGEVIEAECYQSGPALDGGAHARYALALIDET